MCSQLGMYMQSHASTQFLSDYGVRVNENAYTPQAVSIGPIHRCMEGLLVTAEEKDNYLRELTPFGTEDIVRGQEARMRNCYAYNTDLINTDDFVTIILNDARFIIGVLLRYRFPTLQDDNDFMLTEPRLSQLRRDMALLENQVPFFILESIFDPEMIPGRSHYFGERGAFDHHTQDGARGKIRTVPSVRELRQGDVKFELLDLSNNLFDINFHNDAKILSIPKIIISDQTEVTIRNVLAFEQCHHTLAENYMTDYVVFLDRFLSTEEDVRLLVKKRIVEIRIAADAAGTVEGSAKDLIENLTNGFTLDPNSFCFAELCLYVDEYCRSPKILQKTVTVIGLLLSVTANILQGVYCAKDNCLRAAVVFHGSLPYASSTRHCYNPLCLGKMYVR
ncbi:hypothetical protein ACLB2K_022212 [Fragaria x ananassa]